MNARPYFKIPPTRYVFYYGGRFWRGKDTSGLLPGQPTKASEIEFSIAPDADAFDDIAPERNAFLPPRPKVSLTVNGETIYDGYGKVIRVAGRRFPQVEHYVVVADKEEGAL